MNTTQKMYIENEETIGLDFTEQYAFLRLSCGSEIKIDAVIIERLLATRDKNRQLVDMTHKKIGREWENRFDVCA